MKLHHLEYLIDIAHTGSINLSAERLYVSQQSMSRAIKAMEKELGYALLTRTYTGVSLTEAGKVVVEKGQLIANLMHAMEDDLQALDLDNKSTLSGRLAVKANFQATASIIPHVVFRFAKLHPAVTLNVTSELAASVVRRIYEEELKVGLIGISPRTLDVDDDYREMFEQIYVKKLYTDDILICVSKHLSLAQRDYLEPKDLQHIPQVSFGYQPPINQIIFRDTQLPSSLLETSSGDLLKRTIKQGLGFGLSNGLDAKLNYSKLDKQDLTFVPLKDEYNFIEYYLLYNEEALTCQLSRAFMACVDAFMQEVLL